MNCDTYCVYRHTSPSGKVYIGITKKNPLHRWANGNGYKTSPHFWSAIQKYGWDSFSHEILYDGLDVEEACLTEQRLIKEHCSDEPQYGYNEKAGGQKGSALNEAARKKISEANKKYFQEHPEAARIASERNRGYRHTEEAKKKMSDAAKRRHYKLTDEWKRNIGNANKERLSNDIELYEETCARCKANGEKVAKAVAQLGLDGTYIATFKSAHEAERTTGIKNGNISNCCRGLARSAGGYKWQYADKIGSGREIAV